MAIIPGRGHKSYLQLVPEATASPGVKVATATRRFEVISMDVHPEIGTLEDPSLNNQASRRAIFPGGINYKGSIVVRANYEGFEELYRGAMGNTGHTQTNVDAGTSVSCTANGTTTLTSAALFTSAHVVGGGVSGPGVPANTYITAKASTSSLTVSNIVTAGSEPQSRTLGTTKDNFFVENAQLRSYSMQMIEGAPQDVATCNTLVGAYITGFTVRGTAGQGADGMLQCELGILAMDKVIGDTVTPSLTPPTPWPALFYHGLAASIDPGTFPTDTSSNTRVRSFELALTSPHAEDRFYMSAQNAELPIRNDFLTAKWTFTLEYLTDTALTLAKAGTITSPQMIFQHPTLIGTSAKREFEVRSATAIVDGASNPVAGYGIVLQTVTCSAYNDGTGDSSCVLVRTRNGVQSGVLPA